MSKISETEIKSMTKGQNYMRGYEDGKSDVLDKIRAEIESNMESIIGKYGSNTPARDMPSAKIERNSARMEALEIIDKYKEQKVRNTMQIVIEIPEKRYKDILRIAEVQLDMRTDTVEQIIANGTPLPKGHGRLIDADALKKYIDDCDCCLGCEDESYGCVDKCKCPDYLDEGMERIINNQPTIIEADKESEEA